MDGTGDVSMKAGLRYLRILEELSKGDPSRPVKLAEVGRRLGLSRQLVHKYVQTLVKEGYVVKVGRYYVLSDRGKALLEITSEAGERVKRVTKAFAEMIHSLVRQFLEEKGLRGEALYVLLIVITIEFLAMLSEALSTANSGTKDKVLDDLWREQLKGYVKVVLDVLQIRGLEGLEAVGRAMFFLLMVVLSHLTIRRVTAIKEETMLNMLNLIRTLLEPLRRPEEI